MNNKMHNLMHRRGELLAEIAVQREQMIEIGAHWQPALALADEGVAAVRFLRSHPLLSAGVAAFFAMRYRGVAGLASGAWRVWKGYRYFTFFATKLLSRD
jgi:hypothetical protein